TMESHLLDVRSLLLSAYSVGPDAPIANPDLLRWKYFDPKVNGNRPRGYILRQENKVVAHCGVTPVRFLRKDREVSGVCFMDWAGDTGLPGISSVLLRQLMETSEVAVVAEDSEVTRAVIPRLGCVPYGTLKYFARIVRPLKRYLSRTSLSQTNLDDLATLARNALWSLPPLAPLSADWSVKPVLRFEPGTGYNQPAKAFTLTRRDPEILNYWLRCPSGAFFSYLILHAGEPCGYFLLNRLGWQTRIVDLRVLTEESPVWQAAYALAARQAAEDLNTCEILTV